MTENFWVALIEYGFGFAGVVFATLWGNRRLSKKVDKLAMQGQENHLNLLRLTVMSEDMPISERIIAGDKYVKAGGNGDVKAYYQTLVDEITLKEE